MFPPPLPNSSPLRHPRALEPPSVHQARSAQEPLQVTLVHRTNNLAHLAHRTLSDQLVSPIRANSTSLMLSTPSTTTKIVTTTTMSTITTSTSSRMPLSVVAPLAHLAPTLAHLATALAHLARLAPPGLTDQVVLAVPVVPVVLQVLLAPPEVASVMTPQTTRTSSSMMASTEPAGTLRYPSTPLPRSSTRREPLPSQSTLSASLSLLVKTLRKVSFRWPSSQPVEPPSGMIFQTWIPKPSTTSASMCLELSALTAPRSPESTTLLRRSTSGASPTPPRTQPAAESPLSPLMKWVLSI